MLILCNNMLNHLLELLNLGTSMFRAIFKCLQPNAKRNFASVQSCCSFGYNSLREQSDEDSALLSVYWALKIPISFNMASHASNNVGAVSPHHLTSYNWGVGEIALLPNWSHADSHLKACTGPKNTFTNRYSGDEVVR